MSDLVYLLYEAVSHCSLCTLNLSFIIKKTFFLTEDGLFTCLLFFYFCKALWITLVWTVHCHWGWKCCCRVVLCTTLRWSYFEELGFLIEKTNVPWSVSHDWNKVRDESSVFASFPLCSSGRVSVSLNPRSRSNRYQGTSPNSPSPTSLMGLVFDGTSSTPLLS